jgi:hypothetical protein
MNKTLDAMMTGFADALDQQAMQYGRLGRYELAAEFGIGASVLRSWVDDGLFEDACDNENERRGVARDASAQADGWSGEDSQLYLMAEARKLK